MPNHLRSGLSGLQMLVSAADKSVIAKFLKDNDITADADSEEMQDLRDEFDDELAARREARKQEILNKISGSDSEDLLEGIV